MHDKSLRLLDRFDYSVEPQGWTLNEHYRYCVSLPILGSGDSGGSWNMKSDSELLTGDGHDGSRRVVYVTHCGLDGVVTSARLYTPPDVMHPSFVIGMSAMYGKMNIDIHHVLKPDWDRLVERLCVASLDGDLQMWVSIWDEMKAMTLKVRSRQRNDMERALVEYTTLPADLAARVSTEAVFTAGWSLGACMKALFHANRAVADRVPGAKAVLDRLLATGDLTTDNVRGMFENGLAITRKDADDEWILVEKNDSLWANRTVLKHFGIDPSSLTRFLCFDSGVWAKKPSDTDW